MKSLLLAVAAVCALSSSSFALSPEAEAFIRSIGLDPQSASVKAADAEGTIDTVFRGDAASYSLEALAVAKKKNGVLAFIATRAFIHKLEANASTPIPKVNYDGMYLTQSQRLLVAQRMADAA